MDSFGTPAKPVDRSGIEGKFRALTGGLVPPDQQDKILAAALGLSQAQDVRMFADLLGKVGLGR